MPALPLKLLLYVSQAHRTLAYSSACKEVGKWLPIITHNRRADHLSFPLQEETVLPPSLTSRAEGFQVGTTSSVESLDVCTSLVVSQ